MEKVLRKLALEYQDLNGTDIRRVDGRRIKRGDWYRWLHIGRPVLIENDAFSDWNARSAAGQMSDHLTFGQDDEEWTDAWLEEVFGSRPLSIAVTPDGEADSLKQHSDDQTYFVEPLTEKQDMASFLASLAEGSSGSEVRYLQSQNGNIYNASVEETELQVLRKHVPVNVPFVASSTDTLPDAVNLWIGDHRSVTSLHSDPYENIYHVVRGVKYFTLFPPTETFLFEEREYPHASYTRDASGHLQLTPSDTSTHPPVPWLSFDPDNPPPGTQPVHVTVNAGETLYLPAGWNHYVRQAGPGGGEGVCVALNWWYDVEMEGMPWIWLSFLRKGLRYLEDDDAAQEQS